MQMLCRLVFSDVLFFLLIRRPPRSTRTDTLFLYTTLFRSTVATSIRETTGRRLHRFSWINEWKELADAQGTPLGIELILPDWFYVGVVDAALVLTIDPAYFKLTGGIERWLYRLDRKSTRLNSSH